jgi:RNA polymerase sporulation-specific sigma factor
VNKTDRENVQKRSEAEPSDDSALLRLAATGDNQAMDQLLTRFKGLVRHKASAMYMAGADSEDVIQEGMIGLFKAIRTFQPEMKVPFAAFASACISSQITDAVRQASRKKHQLLNQSVSLQSLVGSSDPGEERPLADLLDSATAPDPEQAFLNQESMADLRDFIQNHLSVLERQTVLLFIQNQTYQQIAGNLGVPAKTVDNALRRARRKFMLYRNEARDAAMRNRSTDD